MKFFTLSTGIVFISMTIKEVPYLHKPSSTQG